MGDDEGLDPLGLEFWLGQLLLIAGATAGVIVAAKVGFAQATRLARHEDQRLAATALALVADELDDDLAQVARARDALRANRPAHLAIATDALDAAEGQAYLSSVDPEPLAEVELLFAGRIPAVADLLAQGDLTDEERADAAAILDRVWHHGHDEVAPALAAELARVSR